jgi:PRTRC genetic system protein B
VVRTKLVSALDMAHALARELDLTSGVLPPDALWWARTATGVRVAVWREPRVWTVRLRECYDAKPRRLRLPLPGLVFVCLPARQAPYVFAARARPRGPDDELCHCPTYNVFPTGRVCPGSHHFPADPSRVPEEFFRSYFSATGDTGSGKSRRHPRDIGALWAELDGQAHYPLDDLVPLVRVADALRLGT